MSQRWLCTVVLLGISTIALAEPLASGESFGTNLFTLTFGASKQGDDSLRGTGLENHDAFGNGANLRSMPKTT